MRFFKLILLTIVLLAIAGVGVMYFLAGREAGPVIIIGSPTRYIGRATPLSITVESQTPVSDASVNVEQNGKPVTIADLKRDVSGNKVILSGTVGRDGLVNGPAKVTATAARKTFYGMRTVTNSAERDVIVRLDP